MNKKIIVFVLLAMIFMFATWHVDLAAGRDNVITSKIDVCGSNLTITAERTINGHNLTNGFYKFSSMEIYHLALYLQIGSFVFMLFIGLDSLIKESCRKPD